MNDKIVVQYKIGDSEIKLTPKIVVDYLTNGQQISMQEFKMFSELCKVRKLNPFTKECYIIKFGNQPAQIVVGKDAILKRAITHPQFDGREQGIIIENSKGEIEERKGTFKTEDEKLLGGWAKVYRKDWKYPTSITVSFQEVAQKKQNGELNNNWATKSATMVEKVALVRALRESFAEELGGLIDEDEIWNSQNLSSPRETIEAVVEEQIDPLENQPKPINIDEI